MESNVFIAFGLTLFAGLATGLCALVIFISKRPPLILLSFGLGFSCGVMVFISLAVLLPQATEQMGHVLGEKPGGWLALGCFFGGILISSVIDKLVPEPDNPHEAVSLDDIKRATVESSGPGWPETNEVQNQALARLGLLSALAIGVHNFPEGMATFAAALTDLSLGLSVAVAVAIHNIPEGIAVAVPIYFATRNRSRAFWQSFITGLAEPAGALLVWLVLLPFINDVIISAMLAAVAGIMVFISFDELLPTAKEYGRGHTAMVGVILGMAVMAVSQLLI
jgi:ZIP family zinc transporter